MQINVEFDGLKELIKAFEDAASDEDVEKVNKSIVEKAAPKVKSIMSKKMPKSANIRLSGRGFGTKSSVSRHAAEEIPTGRTKTKDGAATLGIGWEKNTQDSGGHFYVRFVNWGTIYKPPREFIYATGNEADPVIQKIAEQEYQQYLNQNMK